MAADLLSDVLAMVRLSGALLFRVEVRGSWFIESTISPVDLAPLLTSDADHLSAFHIVLEGRCWLRCLAGDWLPVDAGQAAVLPGCDAHQLGDRPGAGDPLPIRQLLRGQPIDELRELHFDIGAGDRTVLLCGFLGSARGGFEPLFAALPELFKIAFDGASAPLLHYAAGEVLRRLPGERGLRTRLAELLFLEALRKYMQTLPADATGWLAGYREPLVGKALRLLHDAPGDAWSVATLAAEVGCSRSVLAGRFKQRLGQAPMHYLTGLRMQLAAKRLTESRSSIDLIAEQVGYDSSAAFQRAFKRNLGLPPATWRRRAGGHLHDA